MRTITADSPHRAPHGTDQHNRMRSLLELLLGATPGGYAQRMTHARTAEGRRLQTRCESKSS